MPIIEPSAIAFILRFWLEHREIEGAVPVWRGVLKHVPSGEQFFFEGLDQLPAVLSPFLVITDIDEKKRVIMIDDAVHPKIEQQDEQVSKSQMSGLAAALARLDGRIESALDMLPEVFGSDAAHDLFRGMHISPQEVAAMLARKPGLPLFILEDDPTHKDGFNKLDEDYPHLALLARVYSLSSFDLDVLLLAIAPEVDSRYERLYAYLQDDVSRRMPSIELALNLLCSTFDEKLTCRARFTSQSPLIRNDILHIVQDPIRPIAPFLAQNLKLDPQIVQFLLDVPGLDQRLVHFCELVFPTISLQDLPYSVDFKQAILTLLVQSLEATQSLCIYFQSSPGSGRRYLIEALAHETGHALLVADIRRISQTDPSFETNLKLLFRQVWFQDAVLFIDGLDELLQPDQEVLFLRFQKILAAEGWITILAGEQPWRSLTETARVIQIPFRIPESLERQAWWSASLSDAGVKLGTTNLEKLTNRFRLSPGQIETAVVDALGKARWRQANDPDNSTGIQNPTLELAELFAAARAQTGHQLSTLTQKIQPRYTWDDIVLPEDSLIQLHELCQWVIQREKVLGKWGFERKLSLGKGTTALFAGPSGTGKTMAAEIIASELGLDLYRIDLSTVVSKYIGETEKNLERIFNAAENANAILFFDEADALFGKRSEVRDSHDRYANIEISYLLQKMEQYDGIAILASNLHQNLDEAFTRRLAFIVPFPFPDEDQRKRIWQGIFPGETPVDEAVDLAFLACQFRISGGNIKNIALSAAFLAASDGGMVTMTHLFQAIQSEFLKLGKTLSDTELYGERRAG